MLAKKMALLLFIVLSALALFGCGGGGGSNSGSAPTGSSIVSGVASNGAAMSGTVYLKDSMGAEKNTVIGNGGSFAITVDGMTAPFLLKAVSTDNTLTRYSFASASGTVNINPLTHLAVVGAVGTSDLDTFYKSAYVSQQATVATGFNNYVASLKNQLESLFTNFNVTDTDFVNGNIQIGSGVDAIFDKVNISVNTSTNAIAMYGSSPSQPFLTMTLSGNQMALTTNTGNMPTGSQTVSFNMAQTLSEGAQSTTLAFDGLALITGNLDAQSFFPPGKVADYTGFQYLRDNDPDNMGHNTSFLTRVANNVIYILNDSQLAQLNALATAQLSQVNLYAYKRYPLMQAFRRQIDNNIPTGSSGLNLNSVKHASRDLYLIDGQISFDRAVLYSGIINGMTSTQKAYLDAMKGKGWNSWPDITDAQISSKMTGLPQGTATLIMTYASDIYSWYAGSLAADVYFCPERHGTYYGGFYIKDAPAVGHEGYSISEQLTATAGAALIDSSQGYVTKDQATLMSSLVSTQKNNLYAGSTNIVQVRTQIATLLRSLLVSTTSSDAVKTQVLALSSTYGDLDGENNYNYATVFAQVYNTLTTDQKTKFATLRKSVLSGTYSDGTAFDYTVATTPFLYADVITDTSVLTPYIGNTDYLFFEP